MNVDPSIIADDENIVEGANPAPGVLILTCAKGDNYDDQDNRILVLRENTFLDFGAAGDLIQSIIAHPNGRAIGLMRDSGTILQFEWNHQTQKKLKASRTLIDNPFASYPMATLGYVGDSVICVGSCHQVHRFGDGEFEELPKPSGSDHLALRGLCGNTPSDMIVVGDSGYCAHFNGSEWRRWSLPTTAHLNDICPVGNGFYAVAGRNTTDRSATLLIGNESQWKDIGPSTGGDYTSVAFNEDRLYAARGGGIDFFHQNKLSPFVVKGKSQHEFYGLANGPDGVWSLSNKSIGLIKDGKWRQY